MTEGGIEWKETYARIHHGRDHTQFSNSTVCVRLHGASEWKRTYTAERRRTVSSRREVEEDSRREEEER